MTGSLPAVVCFTSHADSHDTCTCVLIALCETPCTWTFWIAHHITWTNILLGWQCIPRSHGIWKEGRERCEAEGQSWTDRLGRMTCSDLLTVLSYSILNVIACSLLVHLSCCCRCSMSSRTSHTVTWCSRSWLRGAGWRRERSCLPSPTAGLREKTSANVLYPLQWRRCVH